MPGGRCASDPAPLPERSVVPDAERVISASGVPFRIGGKQAFYVPRRRHRARHYYRTALHELVHNAVTRTMPHGGGDRSVYCRFDHTAFQHKQS